MSSYGFTILIHLHVQQLHCLIVIFCTVVKINASVSTILCLFFWVYLNTRGWPNVAWLVNGCWMWVQSGMQVWLVCMCDLGVIKYRSWELVSRRKELGGGSLKSSAKRISRMAI